MENFVVRRIKPEDYVDIHALNNNLGYQYEERKVKDRIINILGTGSDIITVAELNGKVVGYIHGSPYNTLYADNLLNIVAIVFSDEIGNNSAYAKVAFQVFEDRAKKNGYHGMRMVADVERSALYDFMIDNKFENKRDLKHYIKYFE